MSPYPRAKPLETYLYLKR